MNTCSLSFPNMFDVSRNKVGRMDDKQSITNRVRLLILTDPTELYMNPTFGVGLKKYMFQYINDNTISLIRDKIVEQLKLWEPCVDADATTVVRGLTYTGSDVQVDDGDYNHLKLTVTLHTIYGETAYVTIS